MTSSPAIRNARFTKGLLLVRNSTSARNSQDAGSVSKIRDGSQKLHPSQVRLENLSAGQLHSELSRAAVHLSWSRPFAPRRAVQSRLPLSWERVTLSRVREHGGYGASIRRRDDSFTFAAGKVGKSGGPIPVRAGHSERPGICGPAVGSLNDTSRQAQLCFWQSIDKGTKG